MTATACKLLVIESNEALKNRIYNLLSAKGYTVSAHTSADSAFDQLKTDGEDPFYAVICSFQMPVMNGSEILQKIRKISPATQRILTAEPGELKTMVNAINHAQIQACITLPFQDEVLLYHVQNCCHHFSLDRKRSNLIRTTQRQNKQLFQIAANFKKKGAADDAYLAQKEKEIRVLESRIRSAGGSTHQVPGQLLTEKIEQLGVRSTPEAYQNAFNAMADQIRSLLETAAASRHLTVYPLSTREIPRNDPPDPQAASTLLSLLLPLMEKKKTDMVTEAAVTQEAPLEEIFSLSLSDDRTQARIKVNTDDTEGLALIHVRQFLEMNQVINGLTMDKEIEIWLQNATSSEPPFVIAEGRKAIPPKDAQVRYHFETDFLHAGTINDDGSIDFQERGDIPYVEAETLLAVKTPAEEGKTGMTVHGEEILVDDPVDLTFSSGSGTRISEDGTRIYADTAGQPHLDAMGNVTVCPEYQIRGDIGLETGNINFDGNVVVSGAVKQGFKVQCASLTAHEIQGAEVDIEGDLNVSNGIMDTELVKVKGTVQAKFVRNSKINAFGDLITQKEIVDSTIYLSGACINDQGSIINSTVSAKLGISAGLIGNKASKPCELTVGVDEHTEKLIARINSKLNINNQAIEELTQEKDALKKEELSLHAEIAQHAHVQDRAQLELKDIQKKVGALRASGNMAALQKVALTVKEIQANAQKAEQMINEGFDRQDDLSNQIMQKERRINEFTEINTTLLDEKKRLQEFSMRNKPVPELKVGKQIQARTKIFSKNSSLNMNTTTGRSRIREICHQSGGLGGMESHEMKIMDY